VTFVVTNLGGLTLTGSASVGGAPFAVDSGTPFSVDGYSSTNVVVSFTPTSEGVSNDEVVFTSNGGDSTNSLTGTGAIVPSASFSGSPTIGLAPLLVTFTDTSTGTITNRFYDFGDGGTTNTTATSVDYTYNSAGTNTVTLIVSGPLGASTNIQTDYIVATNAVTAQLGVSPASHDFGTIETGTTAQVTFVVTNLGGLTLTGSASVGGAPFAVDSGSPFSVDGYSSTNVVVSFTPTSEGVFTDAVVFASNGGDSTNDLTGTGAIVPAASFSGSPTGGIVPLTVTFTDTSTGTITNRFWDFGDGGTTNTASTNFVYNYAATGTNTVTLIVSGPLGASTNTQVAYITVTNPPPPVADFTGTPTDGFVPLLVTFTNLTTGAVSDYDWDFGDGGTSTTASPSHTYTNFGKFTVSLTATGPGGSSQQIRGDYIRVRNLPGSDTNAPVASVGSPTNGTHTTDAEVNVTGNADDDSLITSVVVSNDRGGSTSAILVDTNWVAADVHLFLGTNILTVVTTDGGGNQVTHVVTVIRDAASYVNTTLRTTKATLTLGSTANSDAISVSGVYNDADFTLNSSDPFGVLFGDYEAMLPSDSLVNFKYKAKASPTNTLTGLSFKTKKRSFTFAATGFGLTNGAPYNVAIAAGMTDLGPDAIGFGVASNAVGKFSYSYGSQLPSVDLLFLGKSKLTTNSFSLTGQVRIGSLPDPRSSVVYFGIGTQIEALPTNGWVNTVGNVYTYTRPGAHDGPVQTMTLNLDAGTWSANGSGASVDLTFLTGNPTTDIYLEVADFAAVYRAKLVAKGKGFKY
jgi:PKD repeat protein